MQYRGFNWIDALEGVARDQLMARAKLRRYPKPTILCRQGETIHEFFQVLGGAIRKYVLNDAGQEVLFYIYGVGDVVADSSAIDRGPFPVTISTQGETLLRVWDVEDFLELRSASPAYDAAIAIQACHRLRGALQLIQELVTLPATSRVAAHLAMLTEIHACGGSGREIEISQADLGAMIGITRQTVSAIVKELKRDGLVETAYGKIFVKNVSGLREFAARAGGANSA